jgi:hypothetical protein
MTPSVAYLIASALWKDRESALRPRLYMERRCRNENDRVSWSENMRLMDWDPTRIANAARGNEAKPNRRATRGDWSTYECYVWCEHEHEIRDSCGYLSGTSSSNSARAGQIAAQNICIAFINRRSDMVKLRNKRVLEPIN